jgi:hypothetical protein
MVVRKSGKSISIEVYC